jgi:hypothetical protein
MISRIGYSRREAAEVEEITAFLAENSRSVAHRFSQAISRAEQQPPSFLTPGHPDHCPARVG